MLLDRITEISRLSELQFFFIFLSLGSKHFGNSFTSSDSSYESLQLDKTLQTSIEFRTTFIFLFLVLTYSILLHKSSLLLQLILGRIWPHVVLC